MDRPIQTGGSVRRRFRAHWWFSMTLVVLAVVFCLADQNLRIRGEASDQSLSGEALLCPLFASSSLFASWRLDRQARSAEDAPRKI